MMLEQEHPGLTKSEKKKICGLMDCKKLSVDACMHAVQNDRLPLRLVVRVLFFEQLRASASASAGNGADIRRSARLLLPRENDTSYASSRSAAEDDWDGAVGDASSPKSTSLVGVGGGVGGGSERSRGGGGDGVIKNAGEKEGNGKVKGMLMPKKILSKFWSSKGQGGENSNSDDTSESPGSTNLEESRSTPSRNTRPSVS